MPEYAFEIEMAQNSNHSFLFYFYLEILITCLLVEVAHFFSSKILKWLKIRREIEFEAKMNRILSHFNIFELKKVSHFGQKTCDLDFEEEKREK